MFTLIDNQLVHIPEWANWIATDKNGGVYAYAERPVVFMEDRRWYSDARSERLAYLKDQAEQWQNMCYMVYR